MLKFCDYAEAVYERDGQDHDTDLNISLNLVLSPC